MRVGVCGHTAAGVGGTGELSMRVGVCGHTAARHARLSRADLAGHRIVVRQRHGLWIKSPAKCPRVFGIAAESCSSFAMLIVKGR